MRTCRIAPFLAANLPPDIVNAFSENIDMISAVTSLDCSGIGGLEHLGAMTFGQRLNIIHGKSGCGRTRLLDEIKSKSNGSVTFHPLPPCNFSGRSTTQSLIWLIESLVDIQPADTCVCLLLDDVLDFLDADLAQKLFRLLGHQRLQSILTAKPRHMELVSRIVCKEFQRVEEIAGTPALMRCR